MDDKQLIRLLADFIDLELEITGVEDEARNAIGGEGFLSAQDVGALSASADRLYGRLVNLFGPDGSKIPNQIAPGSYVRARDRIEAIRRSVSQLRDDNFFELKLAAHLRLLREKSGISQDELAKRLGLTGGAIRHIEGGRRPLTMTRAREWANACGHSITVDFFERKYGAPKFSRYDPDSLAGGVNTVVHLFLSADQEDPATEALARATLAYIDAYVKN